jgi:hypothetical protein
VLRPLGLGDELRRLSARDDRARAAEDAESAEREALFAEAEALIPRVLAIQEQRPDEDVLSFVVGRDIGRKRRKRIREIRAGWEIGRLLGMSGGDDPALTAYPLCMLSTGEFVIYTYHQPGREASAYALETYCEIGRPLAPLVDSLRQAPEVKGRTSPAPESPRDERAIGTRCVSGCRSQ